MLAVCVLTPPRIHCPPPPLAVCVPSLLPQRCQVELKSAEGWLVRRSSVRTLQLAMWRWIRLSRAGRLACYPCEKSELSGLCVHICESPLSWLDPIHEAATTNSSSWDGVHYLSSENVDRWSP